MENSLAVEIKQTASLLPCNSTTSFIPKRNEYICSQKDLNKNFHRKFIHNIQRLEITQMAIKRGIDKRTVVWSHNRKLLAIKQQTNDAHNNIDKHQKHWVR